MGNGFEHAHQESSNDYHSIHANQKTLKKATKEQIFTEPQLKSAAEAKRKYIGMYLGSELPEKMMTYVIETSQHLGHDLAVISFERNTTIDELLAPYAETLEENNIKLKKVKLTGQPISELKKYLKNHRDIAFLACKDSGFLGRSYMSGDHAKLNLPVPLVVVTTDQDESVQLPVQSPESKGAKPTKVA